MLRVTRNSCVRRFPLLHHASSKSSSAINEEGNFEPFILNVAQESAESRQQRKHFLSSVFNHAVASYGKKLSFSNILLSSSTSSSSLTSSISGFFTNPSTILSSSARLNSFMNKSNNNNDNKDKDKSKKDDGGGGGGGGDGGEDEVHPPNDQNADELVNKFLARVTAGVFTLTVGAVVAWYLSYPSGRHVGWKELYSRAEAIHDIRVYNEYAQISLGDESAYVGVRPESTSYTDNQVRQLLAIREENHHHNKMMSNSNSNKAQDEQATSNNNNNNKNGDDKIVSSSNNNNQQQKETGEGQQQQQGAGGEGEEVLPMVSVNFVGTPLGVRVLHQIETWSWIAPFLFFPLFTLVVSRAAASIVYDNAKFTTAIGTRREALLSQAGEQFQLSKKTKTRFRDIAGMLEAKAEIMEIVDFLKNPDRYTKMGAKIPAGALLLGSPGVGKTYLAKSVAGESNTPFIACCGSDFVELYAGMGALRVRKLFELARTQTKCIIYIDEIDAIGCKRTGSGMGEASEQEHTLNEILTQLDGFNKDKDRIIVLGSTNAEQSMLDTALIRPGRFDRMIHIESPVLSERVELFQLYLKGLKLLPNSPPALLSSSSSSSPSPSLSISKEKAKIDTSSLVEKVEVKTVEEEEKAEEQKDGKLAVEKTTKEEKEESNTNNKVVVEEEQESKKKEGKEKEGENKKEEKNAAVFSSVSSASKPIVDSKTKSVILDQAATLKLEQQQTQVKEEAELSAYNTLELERKTQEEKEEKEEEQQLKLQKEKDEEGKKEEGKEKEGDEKDQKDISGKEASSESSSESPFTLSSSSSVSALSSYSSSSIPKPVKTKVEEEEEKKAQEEQDQADDDKLRDKKYPNEHTHEFLEIADSIAHRMANLCPGFVGADIASVCNEAAILASRENSPVVTMNHLERSIDRVLAGIEHRSRVLSEFEKKVVAHHEAGHAVAGWFLGRADPLMKVSIVPRGGKALGYAQYLPNENQLRTNAEIEDSICVTLGGRVAEKIFFDHLSTGASDDLQKIRRMAYMHASSFGRQTAVESPGSSNTRYTKPYGEETERKIDDLAKQLTDRMYQRTFDLLLKHKKLMELLAEHLLKHEVLTYSDIVKYMGNRMPRPKDEKNIF